MRYLIIGIGVAGKIREQWIDVSAWGFHPARLPSPARTSIGRLGGRSAMTGCSPLSRSLSPWPSIRLAGVAVRMGGHLHQAGRL